jgi:hypothetical protein
MVNRRCGFHDAGCGEAKENFRSNNRLWRPMPDVPYLKVTRPTANMTCVKCWATHERRKQFGGKPKVPGLAGIDALDFTFEMQPELVVKNRELTKETKQLRGQLGRRDKRLQGVQVGIRKLRREHKRAMDVQRVKTFKEKGIVRLSVLDTLVDLHVHCSTPMRRCAQAVILSGKPAGIEWKDTVSSQAATMRALIQRRVLAKLILAEKVAGIECLEVDSDGTTTYDLRSVLGLRVNWLECLNDECEAGTEDDGHRSEFGGLLEMRRGKTADALVAALQLFTDELRTYQAVLNIPEDQQTYMYNWREAGLDNEVTNLSFVKKLNVVRRTEVATKAAQVSSKYQNGDL